MAEWVTPNSNSLPDYAIRFAFNCYYCQHIIYVRVRHGNEPFIILSKDGVAQGYKFVTYCYGIALIMLAERMHAAIVEALHIGFADDLSATGQVGPNAKCMRFLVGNRLQYGYFPEEVKSIYFWKDMVEEVVRAAFTEVGINTLTYSQGQRYIVSFIECGTFKEEFIQAKVHTWVSAVGVFTKLVVNYPQAVYTGYTPCLQGKWQYLCRVMPDITPFWSPWSVYCR